MSDALQALERALDIPPPEPSQAPAVVAELVRLLQALPASEREQGEGMLLDLLEVGVPLAADVLAHSDSPRVRAALHATLSHYGPRMQLHSARALRTIDPHHPAASKVLDDLAREAPWPFALGAVLALSEAPVQRSSLMAALEREDNVLRTAAAIGLADTEGALAQLASPNPSTRTDALAGAAVPLAPQHLSPTLRQLLQALSWADEPLIVPPNSLDDAERRWLIWLLQLLDSQWQDPRLGPALDALYGESQAAP